MQETQVQSLGWEDLKLKWQPTPVFLREKPHGQRSLADYSPWGCNELDMAEWLGAHVHTHTHPSFIDEDNEVQRSRIPVPMAELAAFWKWETKAKEASRRQASGVWNTAWEEHWTYHVDTLVTNRLVISRKELIFLNLTILNSEIKAFHENCWFPNVSTHRNHRGLLSSAPLTHPQFLIQ